MVLDKNPFGVQSDIKLTPRRAFCDCCRIRFRYETYEAAPEVRNRCDECADHDLAGSVDEQLRALRDHEPRFREWIKTVRQKADEMEADVGRMKIQDDARREQVRSALQTRNAWQRIAIAALDEHFESAQRGRCNCGLKHPCRTLRAAEHADHGKLKWIERGRDGRIVADYDDFQRRKHILDEIDDGMDDELDAG